MSKYEITNNISGVSLGVYAGETADDALDAMALDAGYADYADACDVAPVQFGDISVTLIPDA